MGYTHRVKILLTRPPRRDARDAGLPVPPLGLAYVASALVEAGYDVDIFDAVGLGVGWEEFERYIETTRPDMVGLGTMTPTADIAYRAAKIVRPYTKWIVVGGPHATAVRAKIFTECNEIDHLVIGEGEEVIAPYVKWLEQGETGTPPDGVMTRSTSFREAKISRSIEDIARPARHLLQGAEYRYLMATRRGFATIITSRGCPFRCTFCDKSISGSSWRARNATDVVDEMEELSRGGVGFINIYDDNFTLKRSRVVNICNEIIRRGLDIHWKCEGRVDGVDHALLKLMYLAGCRVVAYGVESGNRESLLKLRKDVTIERVIQAFSETREAGLRTMAYAILGIPGETAKEVRQTTRFIKEIGADYVQYSTLSALPGTELGSDIEPVNVLSPVDSDLSRPTITEIPARELSKLMRDAWRGFYFRPTPMWRIGRDAVNSGSVGEMMRLGGIMLNYQVSSKIR